MSLYVAAHYKNSPNDLQMLSDAPAHHLFCLLGPVDPQQSALPEVLSVVQVSIGYGNTTTSRGGVQIHCQVNFIVVLDRFVSKGRYQRAPSRTVCHEESRLLVTSFRGP